MKKTLCFAVALCFLVFCSCSTKRQDDADLKNDNAEIQTQTGDETVPEIPEEKQPDEEQKTHAETDEPDVEKIMETLGMTAGNGGEFVSDADVFSKCLQMKRLETVAHFTGGNPEYYDFLNNVEIESYKIYPVEFPSEVAEQKAQQGIYLAGEDMYLVEYDVTKGDGEYFSDGKNIYLMIFGYDPAAPGSLRAFVPCEQANKHLFFDVNEYSEFENYFIKEFSSLYGGMLSDGKNYPDSFDFNESVHLITHLMARSGKYNEMPPYTLDEIDSFIKECFDGNKGLTFTEYRDYKRWISMYPLPEADIFGEDARFFGCAYAHGGTTVENSIISEEWKNKYTKTVTIQLYADYSKFAKAKQLEYTFEITENELPKLVLVMQNNNTGHEAAVVSV